MIRQGSGDRRGSGVQLSGNIRYGCFFLSVHLFRSMENPHRNKMQWIPASYSGVNLQFKQQTVMGLLTLEINCQLTKVTNCFPLVKLSRSEEHTSELQSRGHLVCRLLLEKKKP